MNPVHLVTITLDGAVVFQFVTPTAFETASYLAGEAFNAMADCSPPDAKLDYSVVAVPYVPPMSGAAVIIAAARDACS